MNCRACNEPLIHEFINLGHQPPSNSFLTEEQLNEPETTYPLKVFVCDKCFLVQIPESKKASEIFEEGYVYFSSQSPSNVSHAKEFVRTMVNRFELGLKSKVMEIGSNDGYMLQWFAEQGIVTVGIEPSRNPAATAIKKGIPTVIDFFSKDMATHPLIEGEFDLICGINVIAHQPDINDFVEGVRIALKPDGVAVFEFPHLQNLISQCQFDTIYHEHYNYFSFMAICTIFNNNGLCIFDVDEIPEHGGSLRIYAQHKDRVYPESTKVAVLLGGEVLEGVTSMNYYSGFQYRANKIKTNLVAFLIRQKMFGKAVFGYGAAAKGNTLLNYCGIKSDLLPLVVDRSPYKQGMYLPGSHILVSSEDRIKFLKPEFILILPWNIKEEIMEQLSYAREWGAKFVTAIPQLEVR
jgi:SAM-dependent methyltransferase